MLAVARPPRLAAALCACGRGGGGGEAGGSRRRNLDGATRRGISSAAESGRGVWHGGGPLGPADLVGAQGDDERADGQ